MQSSIFTRLTLIAPLILLSSCVTTREPHYYWGRYEQIIHDIYIAPGNADPVRQIDVLSVDIQQAQNTGKPVPPGLYAHLGFIYALQGNISESRAAFSEEKVLFPESAVFIDGMIERASTEKPNVP